MPKQEASETLTGAPIPMAPKYLPNQGNADPTKSYTKVDRRENQRVS